MDPKFWIFAAVFVACTALVAGAYCWLNWPAIQHRRRMRKLWPVFCCDCAHQLESMIPGDRPSAYTRLPACKLKPRVTRDYVHNTKKITYIECGTLNGDGRCLNYEAKP